jgi:hypothetical protein
MLGAVASFVARAAEKLRRQGELAHVLTVFIKCREGSNWDYLRRLWQRNSRSGATGAQLMATLDGLNERFGRGTVRLEAALRPKGGEPVLWQGQAAWRTPTYTTRLEDLLVVS